MRAAVLEEIGKMVIKDVAQPACTNSTIVVKVAACAVCGTDVKAYHHGHRLIHPPRITGHEVSGTVVEAGDMVKDFVKGDRVAVAPAIPCGECEYCQKGMQDACDNLTAIGYHYDGGFAEYMSVPEVALRNGCVNKIPDNVSFEEAAIAEPLACCINGQELSAVNLGNVVVVVGAGPVGCFHVQLAKARGAKKVYLVDISRERLEMSKVAAADVYIDASKESSIDRVMQLTGGRGADVVIVACSSGRAQEDALQMVAKRGNVNFFGGLPKDNPYIRFDSNLPHYREFSVVGTHGSSPRQNRVAIDMISTGRINAKALLTHRLPIERTLEGIEITEKAKGLKVIIAG
jgi:L-iditol 2-dehydrogenase